MHPSISRLWPAFAESDHALGDYGMSRAHCAESVYCWNETNLAWVALLTVFVLAEKLGRIGATVVRVGSVVMIGFGVLILAM